MKHIENIILLSCIFGLVACSTMEEKDVQADVKSNKTEVIVLGTIHGGHLKSKTYGTDKLAEIIKKINPAAILVEIPPNRFSEAQKQFMHTDSIWEARVARFPEYVDVIFPLTKSMKFKIIPTAGWTKQMSDFRNQKLQEISKDSSRVAEWTEYLAGEHLSDSLLQVWGSEDDPLFVNSPKYDEAVEIWAEPYNRLFNDELGLGGWDNINKAHYANIVKVINNPEWKGKRLLITYGAGHKGWFLRELKKRDDIQLIDVRDFISQ